MGLASGGYGRRMSLLASVTRDVDEPAEEGHALCCVTPRERAVPSLRAGKDRDSWQVRSAVCDRVSDADPRIEPTRDVGRAGRAGADPWMTSADGDRPPASSAACGLGLRWGC
jgi:hypothetical protein